MIFPPVASKSDGPFRSRPRTGEQVSANRRDSRDDQHRDGEYGSEGDDGRGRDGLDQSPDGGERSLEEAQDDDEAKARTLYQEYALLCAKMQYSCLLMNVSRGPRPLSCAGG